MRISALLLLIAVLPACGLKGPLILPPPAAEPPPVALPAATSAPAETSTPADAKKSPAPPALQ